MQETWKFVDNSPISLSLCLCFQKNAKEFDVECSVTGRAYHISDPGGGASMWADLINAVLMEKRHLSSVRPTSLASVAR